MIHAVQRGVVSSNSGRRAFGTWSAVGWAHRGGLTNILPWHRLSVVLPLLKNGSAFLYVFGQSDRRRVFQKAFDKVWMEGLLVKLLRNGIASNMFNWIKSYLYNRRARVSVDTIHSKKILLRHGVPQGGVLSPTLFLLFIHDLVSELPKGIKATLYADDLVIW